MNPMKGLVSWLTVISIYEWYKERSLVFFFFFFLVTERSLILREDTQNFLALILYCLPLVWYCIRALLTFLIFFFLSSLIREEFFLSIGDTDERCLCSSYRPIDLSTVDSGFYQSLEKIVHTSILVRIDLGVLQAQLITDLSSQG